MNAGQLRNRITLKRIGETQDTFGQQKECLIDVGTVWASIEPLVGKQFFAAETIHNELTHKIKIRYNKNIKSGMRVCFKDRKFEIVGPPINFQERNVELQLMCRELL